MRSANAEYDCFPSFAQSGERWLPEGFCGFGPFRDNGLGEYNDDRTRCEGALLKPLGRLKIRERGSRLQIRIDGFPPSGQFGRTGKYEVGAHRK
jgi:hypothetical protein